MASPLERLYEARARLDTAIGLANTIKTAVRNGLEPYVVEGSFYEETEKIVRLFTSRARRIVKSVPDLVRGPARRTRK